MIKILLQNGSFAHYGVSIIDGAPGRGSGRYPRDSGKNPRASKRRGASADPSTKLKAKKSFRKSAMLNELSSMDPKRRIGFLRDMAKDIIDGKIGSGAAGELAKKRKKCDQLYINDLAKTTGGNFTDVYNDFEIAAGGSVYRIADVGDDSREGRKYVTGKMEVMDEYVNCYTEGSLGGDDLEAEGRIYKIVSKRPIKIAGYEKTIDVAADEMFGDMTVDQVFLENSKAKKDGLTTQELYEKYLKFASPIYPVYTKASFFKKLGYNSTQAEYDSIKDIKAKDLVKFIYSKEGEVFRRTAIGDHSDEFKDEKNPDVHTLFNILSVMVNATTKQANSKIANYKKEPGTADVYKRITDRLQSEGYSGMMDIEDAEMAVTPMLLFNVDKSGYKIGTLMEQDGKTELTFKKF